MYLLTFSKGLGPTCEGRVTARPNSICELPLYSLSMIIFALLLTISLCGCSEQDRIFFSPRATIECDINLVHDIDWSVLQHQDSILIYTLRKDGSIYRGSLPSHSRYLLTSASGFEKIHIHSPDSIFLFKVRDQSISLINDKGIEYTSWAIPNYNGVRHKIDISPANRPVIYDDVLSITMAPYVKLAEFYDHDHEFKMNLQSNECMSYLRYPDHYSADNWWHVSGNGIYRTLSGEGELVFSFAIHDSLYIYSNRGTHLRTVPAKSRYMDEFPPPPYIDTDQRATLEYATTIPMYKAIIWDKYRNFYYRIATHAQSARNASGRINNVNDRPWSIIVLDQQFRILGEQRFPAGNYYYAAIYPVKDGLLIANKFKALSGLPTRQISSFTLFSISG
jgi:hypothetical protein